MRQFTRFGALAAAAAFLPAIASAQFDNQWVTFLKNSPGHIGPSPTSISDSNNETDLAWGDLDKDGWEDLVIVRKQPFTSTGHRSNLLLMNEAGVLTDMSTALTSSDAAGQSGFDDLTNDRDAVLVDVDLDGWLDVVTATTLSSGTPKSVSHPRIYMNLGNDGGGNWLGLEHQDARIPQIFLMNSSGNPTTATFPRFCSVGFGDITGDGYPDLYFGDYDSGGSGGGDVNNRLFINDGNGFFTDSLRTRMDTTMLLSAFGAASVIADLNGDGVNDVLKQTALNPPQHIAAVYNDPTNEGVFDIYDSFMDSAPYHVNSGDLNNDGRLDIVVSSDGSDRYRLNGGNDFLGRVDWGTNHTFDFLTGGDDGFASNNLIADLDHDGWADALFADVDVDIGGYGRRLHIYHNLGEAGDEGGFVEMREERRDTGNGWLGVVGMRSSDMTGTHDMAVMDIDNDGDDDMVISRLAGTDAWINQTNPTFCQEDFGMQGVGGESLEICGTPLGTGGSATISLSGTPPFTLVVLLLSLDPGTINLLGIETLANVAFYRVQFANGLGAKNIPLNGGSGGNFTVEAYVQYLVYNPSVMGQTGQEWSASNIRQLVLEQ